MDNQKTIVYIGGFELPDRNAAAHQVLNNARALRNIGYRVVFAGIDKQIGWDRLDSHMVVDGFDSYPSPYPSNRFQWVSNMIDSSRIIDIIESQNNVVALICYNMHAIPLIRLHAYAKYHSIKVIANVTEWYENAPSINPISIIKWLDTALVMRWIHKKSDGIIAVSRYLERYYSKSVKSITVIPPLIDVGEDKWTKSVPHAENNVVSYVYSGTIGSGPGTTKDKLCPVLECFFELKDEYDFQFDIIGMTKEQFLHKYSEMEEVIAGLGSRVVFSGRVPHQESVNALKRADYCIFVRDHTRKNMAGFPTKFVESITSGVFVIASNISDIQEYFPHDGHSILLSDNSKDNLRNAIEQSLSFDPLELTTDRRDGLYNNPFDYSRWSNRFQLFMNSVV